MGNCHSTLRVCYWPVTLTRQEARGEGLSSQPVVAGRMKNTWEHENLRDPIRCALGTANERPGCFGVERGSAASRREGRWLQEVCLELVVDRRVDTPMAAGGAMRYRAEVAREWRDRSSCSFAECCPYDWSRSIHQTILRRYQHLAYKLAVASFPLGKWPYEGRGIYD